MASTSVVGEKMKVGGKSGTTLPSGVGVPDIAPPAPKFLHDGKKSGLTENLSGVAPPLGEKAAGDKPVLTPMGGRDQVFAWDDCPTSRAHNPIRRAAKMKVFFCIKKTECFGLVPKVKLFSFWRVEQ